MAGARYYRCKKDTTHEEIAREFEQHGYSILDCSPLKNACDLVAADGNKTYFVECKSKGGKLSSGEVKFHDYFKAPIYVLFSAKEAKLLIENNQYNR